MWQANGIDVDLAELPGSSEKILQCLAYASGTPEEDLHLLPKKFSAIPHLWQRP